MQPSKPVYFMLIHRINNVLLTYTYKLRLRDLWSWLMGSW